MTTTADYLLCSSIKFAFALEMRHCMLATMMGVAVVAFSIHAMQPPSPLRIFDPTPNRFNTASLLPPCFWNAKGEKSEARSTTKSGFCASYRLCHEWNCTALCYATLATVVD
jgi:hypothetical protein